MKEITYTRLRQDLANVLDEIRNGEEFLVTQRGKEPVKLKSAEIKAAPAETQITVLTLNDAAKKFMINAGNATLGIASIYKNLGQQVKAFMDSSDPELISTLRKLAETAVEINKQNKISVEDAVKEVRARHAETIKALEDK
ncbi:type II toxin-antitoxin system Phd/YefM family antitoxin [Yersinia thracica]|uniref:type II toxin-antitoxin system Phd/YefM family antitoxin n=1 Tax=Yersinia TaxID=629 RepID=UPI00119F8AFE|nr:type II toxin-antitoxin system prevent-host-death family antitoxin [Yersinia thracica]